jgi:ATP-dependent DNA ligase
MILNPQKVLSLGKALALKTPKLYGTYLITPKYDGWYTAIRYRKATNTWYAPLSSAGRIIPALAWTVDKIWNKLPAPHEDCMLIAEAFVPDTPFHITNGLLNRSTGNFACKDVHFMLHDIVYDYMNYTADARWNILQSLYIEDVRSYVSKVDLLLAAEYDKDLWYDVFYRAIDNGHEGIVAKRASSVYAPGKRNADLLKLKLECTIDAIADRVERTVGSKYNLGVTLVSKRKSGVEIRTVINELALQYTLLNTPSEVIGKVVEIHGMEELPDGNIRQPTFYAIREDKNISEID